MLIKSLILMRRMMLVIIVMGCAVRSRSVFLIRWTVTLGDSKMTTVKSITTGTQPEKDLGSLAQDQDLVDQMNDQDFDQLLVNPHRTMFGEVEKVMMAAALEVTGVFSQMRMVKQQKDDEEGAEAAVAAENVGVDGLEKMTSGIRAGLIVQNVVTGTVATAGIGIGTIGTAASVTEMIETGEIGIEMRARTRTSVTAVTEIVTVETEKEAIVTVVIGRTETAAIGTGTRRTAVTGIAVIKIVVTKTGIGVTEIVVTRIEIGVTGIETGAKRRKIAAIRSVIAAIRNGIAARKIGTGVTRTAQTKAIETAIVVIGIAVTGIAATETVATEIAVTETAVTGIELIGIAVKGTTDVVEKRTGIEAQAEAIPHLTELRR